MKDSVKKWILAGGVVAVIAVLLLIRSLRGVEDFHEKYDGWDLTVDVEGAVREGTYTRYLNAHKDAAYPEQSVEIGRAHV